VRRSMVPVLFLILFMTLAASGSVAQTGTTPPTGQHGKKEEAKAPSGYPVVLGDKTLFRIKEVKGIPISAQGRAQLSSERLKEVAENFSISVDSVATLNYESPLTLIGAGNRQLLVVLDEDAREEGSDRQELAKRRAQEVREAIREYRREYGIRSILIGGVLVLAATLILVVILMILNRVYRKLEQNIDRWVESKKISLRIRDVDIVRTERLRALMLMVTRLLRFVIYFILLYTYVHSSLSFLPWTRGFADQLFGYIIGPLKTAGRAVWHQVPDLVIIALVVVVTRYVLKMVRHLFGQIRTGAIELKGFYPDWADPTYKICRLFIVAFAAVMAYPYIPGSGSLAFKGISVFLGALISIGSSSAVANVIAGYTLIYRRVFKIGDRVKIADHVGDVVEMRLQVVHLRTIKNEEIVVPSSMIVSSPVINYSFLAKEGGLILHTTVTIGYDTPWRQVEALLLTAAEKTRGLLKEPHPFVLQTSLDDFYVSYELNAYTDRPEEMAQAYAGLHRNIQDTFNEYGVQIMSPSYRGDPVEPKVVPKDQWFAPPARQPNDYGNEPGA